MSKNFAIINGASGGIGGAIAEKLAPYYHLILLGRDEKKLENIAKKIKTENFENKIQSHTTDFRNIDEVLELQEKMEIYRGNIGLLVNSVGIVPVGNVLETEEEEWVETIQTSLMSAVRLVKYFSNFMTKNSSIIFINGVFALQPDPNFIVASSVTGALRNFTKAISKDLIKQGIRVNSVLPAATQTPLWDKIVKDLSDKFQTTLDELTNSVESQNPMGRIASPLDVANAVSFLASEAAGYINGASIVVDGGMSMAS